MVTRNFEALSIRAAITDSDKGSLKNFEIRKVPDYTVRLAEQARVRRSSDGVLSQYIDHTFWEEFAGAKEDVSGILVMAQRA